MITCICLSFWTGSGSEREQKGSKVTEASEQSVQTRVDLSLPWNRSEIAESFRLRYTDQVSRATSF